MANAVPTSEAPAIDGEEEMGSALREAAAGDQPVRSATTMMWRDWLPKKRPRVW